MPITTQQLLALPNLGPRSSGADVRILQQWLVENGYLTQAQMNTGPGTYGQRTKAAVASWQTSKGINTAGNPGYFGPLSKTYLQTTVSAPTAPTSPQFSPAGVIGAIYNDGSGAIWRFNENHQWQQISSGIGRAPKPTPPAPAPAPSPSYTPPSPSPSPSPTPPPPPPPPVAPAKSLFKDSAAYKALSADAQGLVDLAFSTFSGTVAEQQIFADALTQAQTLADPYAKTQLALSLGEFQSKIAFNQGDLTRASEIITRTRDQISEDVKANKEFLTLEQQANIATETRKYDEDLLTIADQAAEKGLTFGTGARSRVLAEERRGTQFQDVIQSSQRQYNFKIKELELKAARGDIDAQKQLEDLQAKSSFNLESIGRSAEKVLGTANLPGTPSYTPVGGVLGDIEQEQRKTILDVAKLGLPQ